jgi:hypothetical protein
MSRILPLVVAVALLVSVPARAEVAKYFPDDTNIILVVDLDKVRQSVPARQIFGKKTIVQFAKEWVLQAQPNLRDKKEQDPAGWARMEAGVGLTDRLVASTKRLTVVVAPNPDGGWVAMAGLLLCEGSYDGDQLLKDLKAVDENVLVKRFGNHAILTPGAGGDVSLTVLDRSVLAISSQLPLEAAVSRAEGKTQPNPKKELAELLKALPRDRAVAAALPALPSDGLIWGTPTAWVDLGDDGIRLGAAFTYLFEDDAPKMEQQARAKLREMAKALADKKLPLAQPLFDAGTIERADKRITVQVTVPTQVAAATLTKLAQQLAAESAPAAQPVAQGPKAAARSDVAKFYPDNTTGILVIDLDRVRQSAPAKQILGKKTIVQLLKEWGLEARPELKKQEPAARAGMEAATTLVDRLVERTSRLTFLLHSPGEALFGRFLLLCEGHYDGEQLFKDIKTAARAAKAPVKLETFGDHDIITTGEKENGLCLALLDNSVLALTFTNDRVALERAIARAEGKSQPRPGKEFLALLRQLPTGRAVALAEGSLIAAFAEAGQGSFAGSVDLGDNGIRLEGAFTVASVEEAKKLELRALTKLREAANDLAEQEMPLAKHVKAATVERAGQRVLIAMMVPAQVVADMPRSLARQAAKVAKAPKQDEPKPAPPAPKAADQPLVFKGLPKRVAGVALSPDGRVVAAVTAFQLDSQPFSMTAIAPGKLMVWPVSTQQPVLDRSLGRDGDKQFFGGTDQLAFHPNVLLLVVSTRSSGWFTEGTVVVWDVAQFREERRLMGSHAALSPDGRTLATYNTGGLLGSPTIGLFDTKTWQQVRRFAAPHLCMQLAFAPDSSLLAGLFDGDGKDEKNQLAIWATANGARVGTVQVPGTKGIGRFAWDAGGAKLALSTRWDGAIRLWDWRQATEVRSVQIGRQGDVINHFALRPDGKKLAIPYRDGVVQIRDLAGGETLALRVPGANFQCLAYSADGHTLAAGTESGLVYLWTVK